MRNFVQNGDSVSVVLAAAAVSGVPIVVGTGLLGIPLISGAIGESIDAAITGVYRLPKQATAVITKGQQVLWDVSVGAVDDDQAVPAVGDFLCGYAWADAGNGETEVPVKINRNAPVVA